MGNRAAILILIASAAFATGCNDVFDCTQVEAFPLEIIPVDGVSGSSVGDSVVATATGDGRVWQLVPHRTDVTGRVVSLWGGGGPGAYRIAVHHPRYLPWDTTNVLVAAGKGCPFVALTVFVGLAAR
jgi:hypothetical protein